MEYENLKKRCISCKQILPIDKFRTEKARVRDGTTNTCKKCHNKNTLIARNLRMQLIEKVERGKAEYPKGCHCCGKMVDFKHLCADHRHDTGELRGWLCHHCTRGIGHLGDNLEGVQNAIHYLEGNVAVHYWKDLNYSTEDLLKEGEIEPLVERKTHSLEDFLY